MGVFASSKVSYDALNGESDKYIIFISLPYVAF